MKRMLAYVIFAVLVVPGFALAQRGPGEHIRHNGPPEELPPAAEPRPQFPPKSPQCVADCRTVLAVCVEDARETSLPCLTNCEALQDTARAACQSDPRSDECRAARIEAHKCLRGCWSELRPLLEECLAGARTCIGDCPVVEDLECWRNCQAERRGCVVEVRDDSRTCRQGCAVLVRTAQQACRGADRSSEACDAARTLASACLDDCGTQVRDGLAACAADLLTCTSLCVAGEDPPPEP